MQYISPLPEINEYNYAQTFPRKLSICGSTGSIGTSTLKLVDTYPELFEITALGAGKNIELLAKQALIHKPPYLVIQEESSVPKLQNLLKAMQDYTPCILHGQSGYEQIASLEEVSVFVSAQVGAAGLRSTLAAAKSGKIICLANKESLVLAGDILRKICMQTKACILPADSEHHALFQCLCGHESQSVRKLILTASGGALRGKSYSFLENATVKEALNHPNWNMGAKISIDSATLMNKGLEVIEACHLYGMDISLIDVVIHPQSIIHSLVEYKDFSCIAQMSVPDMRLSIAHCLSYPHTLEGEKIGLSKLDLVELGKMTFEAVNSINFPCLEIAKQAYRDKKCVALNAANEELVEAFLQEKIRFMQIPFILEKILATAQQDTQNINPDSGMEEILSADNECRIKTKELINKWK